MPQWAGTVRVCVPPERASWVERWVAPSAVSPECRELIQSNCAVAIGIESTKHRARVFDIIIADVLEQRRDLRLVQHAVLVRVVLGKHRRHGRRRGPSAGACCTGACGCGTPQKRGRGIAARQPAPPSPPAAADAGLPPCISHVSPVMIEYPLAIILNVDLLCNFVG